MAIAPPNKWVQSYDLKEVSKFQISCRVNAWVLENDKEKTVHSYIRISSESETVEDAIEFANRLFDLTGKPIDIKDDTDEIIVTIG